MLFFGFGKGGTLWVALVGPGFELLALLGLGFEFLRLEWIGFCILGRVGRRGASKLRNRVCGPVDHRNRVFEIQNPTSKNQKFETGFLAFGFRTFFFQNSKPNRLGFNPPQPTPRKSKPKKFDMTSPVYTISQPFHARRHLVYTLPSPRAFVTTAFWVAGDATNSIILLFCYFIILLCCALFCFELYERRFFCYQHSFVILLFYYIIMLCFVLL